METLPTLEKTIRKIAEEKLNRDIELVHENFSKFLSSQKEGLFRTRISLEMFDEEQKIYPWLSELFKVSCIVDKIKNNCLSEYIEREIKAILIQKSEIS